MIINEQIAHSTFHADVELLIKYIARTTQTHAQCMWTVQKKTISNSPPQRIIRLFSEILLNLYFATQCDSLAFQSHDQFDMKQTLLVRWFSRLDCFHIWSLSWNWFAFLHLYVFCCTFLYAMQSTVIAANESTQIEKMNVVLHVASWICEIEFCVYK